MLGYTTAKQALSEGYTHHASYYGVPIWIGDIDSECPKVAAKWLLLDLLIMLASVVEGLLTPVVHGEDAEPAFMFKIGEPIADGGKS